MEHLLPIGLAAFSGFLLLAAIVEEMYRFLKAKAGGDENAEGGMQHIFNGPGCLFLFAFVGCTFWSLVTFAGWNAGWWWFVLPVGFVVMFFVFCVTSIPIGYFIRSFCFRDMFGPDGEIKKPAL